MTIDQIRERGIEELDALDRTLSALRREFRFGVIAPLYVEEKAGIVRRSLELLEELSREAFGVD